MLKIYLTDLGAYNAGALVGKWLELPMEDEELSSEIQEILSQGETAVDGYNHEEWFITDYEWEEVTLFDVDEYENINELNNNIKLLEEVEPSKLKAIKFVLDEQFTYDIEDAILKADDVSIYENQTLEDVAYDLMQECYGVEQLPSIIANNIDYEGIARELEYSNNYHIVDDDVMMYLG